MGTTALSSVRGRAVLDGDVGHPANIFALVQCVRMSLRRQSFASCDWHCNFASREDTAGLHMASPCAVQLCQWAISCPYHVQRRNIIGLSYGMACRIYERDSVLGYCTLSFA